MAATNFKSAYNRFLQADPARLHFAAHSHHYWPDCTREAQLQYWDDAARLVDQKWDHIFTSVVPRAQMHIARTLNLSEPAQITFAPNTHELVTRLLSCFEPGKPLKILTTDGEFHSFRRQIQRYEELAGVEVERVPVEPLADFSQRFIAEATSKHYDLVFASQVFFNSGFVFDGVADLARALLNSDTMIVIDGYHGFCAVPTDLRAVEDRVFYLAGGYKYAQAGEGACFLHAPRNSAQRPLNTGWFASFSTLEKGAPTVGYDQGMRFWGSTFDPSGLYRFNAVLDWWERENISIAQIHQHVDNLERYFMAEVAKAGLNAIGVSNLIKLDSAKAHGHFLTYRTASAKQIHDTLRRKNVIVDYRGDRLRFGFGLYHDASDVNALIERLKEAKI